MVGDEAGATISDNNGNLLFYTNGDTVYNRNQTMMPNGFGLLGHPSATQGSLIIPKPGSCNIYYIFTASDWTNNWGLNYSIVDMNLDNGMGDVVSKNIFLQSSVTERLTGVLKANGTDYWVISKRRFNNAFYSYSVTSSGVSTTPVVSNTGPSSFPGTYVGTMRISPDRTKLCITKHGIGFSQLCDFDDATGTISNAIPLRSTLNSYGVEFSPDNSKLYVSEHSITGGGISQYNLLAGSATAIQNSVIFMPTPQNLYGLKLGPNNKIYGAIADSTFVSVIDQPNQLGTACNFIYRYMDISPGRCRAGLPNNINHYGVDTCSACVATEVINNDITICQNQTYQLPSGTFVSAPGIYRDTIKNHSNRCDSIITAINLSVFQVSFENVSEQICSNQSYQLTSGDSITFAGIYQDTIRSISGCDSLIKTIHLTVNAVSAYNILDSISEGEAYSLPWGATAHAPGIYQLTLVNSLGCDSLVTVVLKPGIRLGDCITLKNAFTPNGDGINDSWILYGHNCFKKLEVRVFNRYGNIVYHSRDYRNDWKGRYKNKDLPDGTYYYMIKVVPFNDIPYTLKGNVTILR